MADQDEIRERLKRYVAREGLVSCMNDTKWREAVAALSSIQGYRPTFRVRCLRDPDTEMPPWDVSFPEHVPSFIAIEWLEVDPLMTKQAGALRNSKGTDFSVQIRAALDAVNVPFALMGNNIRISGYTRPNSV